MTAKIQVRDLCKIFVQRGANQSVTAIQNLSFEVNEGEVLSIVGKTGCGKSTLLNILIGIEKPTSGYATLDGKAPYHSFAEFRGKVAVVFQQDRLLPWRSALRNAKIGLEILGYKEEEQIRQASFWLDKLGLSGFHNAYPGELSGGMRQRVALARAFSVNPEVLLCDEAFGHLDEVTAGKLRKDYLELVKNTKKTSILVTHQLNEAIEVGERILVLAKPGRVLVDIKIDESTKGDFSAAERLRRKINEMLDTNMALVEAAP